MAGIPWRFSGTSGLYARPEVRLLLPFLRVAADPESSVDLYAVAASDVYRLGGEDLTAIVNMARRRNRSVWAVLEELDRQPGILRVAPETRARRSTSSSPTCAATPSAAHERPAGELLYRFLRASGLLARLVATGHAGRRGGARERRPVLRDRPVAVGAARATTGRSSSRRISRRSSRPATTRRPPSSTRTPTRSRS